jgi:hypothetical protein
MLPRPRDLVLCRLYLLIDKTYFGEEEDSCHRQLIYYIYSEISSYADAILNALPFPPPRIFSAASAWFAGLVRREGVLD